MVMGVRAIDRSLEQWQMGVKDLRRRMILAPTPRERERWYAIWLLAQGWTAAATADDSGTHTQGAGAVVRHLALGAGLDSSGHGGGAGAGPPHHRTVGFGFRRGRTGGLDI